MDIGDAEFTDLTNYRFAIDAVPEWPGGSTANRFEAFEERESWSIQTNRRCGRSCDQSEGKGHHSEMAGNQTIEWNNETPLSNLDALQLGKSINLEMLDPDKTLVTDNDSFQ